MITGRVLPPARPAGPPPRKTVNATPVAGPPPPPRGGTGGAGGGGGGGRAGGQRAARQAAPARQRVEIVQVTGGTGGSAHKIILAEYLAVMIILFATEILGPVGTGSKAPTGENAVEAQSKTFSGILIRMTAASILYFVLALSASGERSGKMAAALGGLVALGAMLNAGPVWKGAARVFGTSTADKKKTPAPEPVGED